MRLEGKVVVVTGGASGIGKATALMLGRHGARVVVVDRYGEGAELVALQIRQNRGDAVAIAADVSKVEECQRIADVAVEAFGRIDILFNNAGVALPGDVVSTTEEEWDLVLAVCLKSAFLTSKCVIPIMRRQGGGVIIHTASELGLVGSAGMVSYCAAKGGLVLLTKAMALDHAHEGIRVNCICPGPVLTPLLRGLREKSGTSGDMPPAPIGRDGQPEEIASAVLYMCSDEAAYMTGASLIIDGGRTAGYNRRS